MGLRRPAAEFRFIEQDGFLHQLKYERRRGPSQGHQKLIEFVWRTTPAKIDKRQPPVAVEKISIDLPIRLACR